MADRIVLQSTYYGVFAALVALTLVTVGGSFVPLSEGWHTVFGLAIATAKAILVALFFMHVLYGPRLTRVVIVGALLWLAILIGLTLSDYLTRDWLAY